MYYTDPDEEEMNTAFPTMLFDKNITDGRAMLCSILTLIIGNNQGMGDVEYGKTTMWKKYDDVIPVEKDFWIVGNIKCWRAETNLATAKKAADKKEKTLKNDVKVSEKLLKTKESKCTNVCNNNKEENYNEQLDRLADYYTHCKTLIKPKLDAIKKVTKQYETAVKQKKLGDAKYEAMKKKCKLIAYRMNNKKCDARKKFAGSCSFFVGCWKRSKMVYNKDVKRIKVHEKEMKIEWRALHRIQCYLLILNIKNDKGLQPKPFGEACYASWQGRDFKQNDEPQGNQIFCQTNECIPEVVKAMRACIKETSESNVFCYHNCRCMW